jgi:hypothetical protein
LLNITLSFSKFLSLLHLPIDDGSQRSSFHKADVGSDQEDSHHCRRSKLGFNSITRSHLAHCILSASPQYQNLILGYGQFGVGSPAPVQSLADAIPGSKKLVFLQPQVLGPVSREWPIKWPALWAENSSFTLQT